MNKLILGIALLFSTAPAFAQDNRPPSAEKISTRLHLDADASARLQTTLEKYRQQSIAQRKDARQVRMQLREQIKSPTPDNAKVTELTNRLAADRQSLGAIRTAKMAELRQQLTPVQYASFLTFKHVHRQGRHLQPGSNG